MSGATDPNAHRGLGPFHRQKPRPSREVPRLDSPGNDETFMKPYLFAAPISRTSERIFRPHSAPALFSLKCNPGAAISLPIGTPTYFRPRKFGVVPSGEGPRQ